MSTDPSKNISFTRLADHPKLLIDHSTLSRSVALHIQQTKMLEAHDETKELLERASPTHQRILLPIKKVDTKVKLLKRAVDKGLSSREFRTLVQAEKKKHKSNRGRKSTPEFQKSWQKCFRIIDGQKKGLDKKRKAFVEDNGTIDSQTKKAWLSEISQVLQYFQDVHAVVSSLNEAPDEEDK